VQVQHTLYAIPTARSKMKLRPMLRAVVGRGNHPVS